MPISLHTQPSELGFHVTNLAILLENTSHLVCRCGFMSVGGWRD